MDFIQYLDQQPLLIVISGHSGAGKDSVIQQIKQRGMPFEFVVTATSRAKRQGEVEGVDYVFVTREQFEAMIERGELIEYAIVYGEYKGVPEAHVRQALTSGKDVLMRVDVQGAETIRRKYPQEITIFLTTRDDAEMIRRLKGRPGSASENLEARVREVQQELERIDEFDYLVVNPDSQLRHTVDTILAIIQAEHQRVRIDKEGT